MHLQLNQQRALAILLLHSSRCLLLRTASLQDVLGHPNTNAFVSHSGLHSVYEAAFQGVPLVSIGFHFESVSACAGG
jgi:hypothetical protein